MAQTTVPAAPKGEGDDPSWVHPEISGLRERHKLNKTLMGGTPAMVKAGELYLPKMRQEHPKTYERRLKLCALRNFYRAGIVSLSGKLMRNGLKVDETNASKLPPELSDVWLKDLDNAGTAGDVLFKRSFTWSIRDAITWLLANVPPTVDAAGNKLTLAAERELRVRPYLTPLSIYDVLGWRKERVRGVEEFTQFRFLMCSEEPVGQFGTKKVETIRVVEPTLITDFRKGNSGDWELHEQFRNTLGRIPITEFASDADEDSCPCGGMNGLAEMNLEHWQVRSDQRLALRIQSFDILFAAGMDALPDIGPESAVLADKPDAKLEYVSPGGGGVSAGRQELVDLEDAMRAQSAQYQARQVEQTATGASIDAKEASSPAQGWAINAKRGFEQAMGDMIELAGKGKQDVVLRVDTDALVSSLDSTAISTLSSARAQREISHEAYIAALKRADLLPDDFDVKADQELIDAEEPADLEGINKPPPKK